MKKQLLAFSIVIIIAIILFLVSSYFFNHIAEIKLSAPENYQVGDLVVLDATESISERLQWTILPETKNFKIVGKTAYFSSSTPDRYTVIITATNSGTLATKVFFLEPEIRNIESEIRNIEPRIDEPLLPPDIIKVKKAIDGGIITTLDGAILMTKQLDLKIPEFKTLEEYKKWIDDNS